MKNTSTTSVDIVFDVAGALVIFAYRSGMTMTITFSFLVNDKGLSVSSTPRPDAENIAKWRFRFSRLRKLAHVAPQLTES